MNRNEYRRALIMLRSLKPGITGYVRLERRTLMGTLQFTLNGVSAEQQLHAVLLRDQDGKWNAVHAGSFGAPRYGQSGLLWKFDPRSIEGKAFEQYSLVTIVGIGRERICDLLLCGNLNGSTETDWTLVREAACRLFSPVRIAGTPIPPISDAEQGLPDHKEETPADTELDSEEVVSNENEASASSNSFHRSEEVQRETESLNSSSVLASSSPANDVLIASSASPSTANPESAPASNSLVSTENTDAKESDQTSSDLLLSTKNTAPSQTSGNISAESVVHSNRTTLQADELDLPAMEPEELDVPASPANQPFLVAARTALSVSAAVPVGNERTARTAGDELNLIDSSASWPENIEPLRRLFYSSESVAPFEMEGYVLIQAPLPAETGVDHCIVGIHAENGVPESVLYAIPSHYTSEPPAGLEGYIWYGNQTSGYWVVTESIDS